jgi:DNA-directed RNA polymerase specialized sigma24 family protein
VPILVLTARDAVGIVWRRRPGWPGGVRGDVAGSSREESLAAVVLPHLDAAYNLARWLMRDPVAAEDVVQEAMLRALTYFASFKGVNPRAWLLQNRAQHRLFIAPARSRRAVRSDR